MVYVLKNTIMKKIITLFCLVILTILSGCTTVNMYDNYKPLEFKDISYPHQSKFVNVNGINISYMDEGNGNEVLLLVHGLASNGGFWRYNISELSKKYRVIAVDLPGYGKSDKGAYKYNMTFYADVLSGMLKALNIPKVDYVGHSMGGQIGIWFSFRHPEQLTNLILVDPAGLEKFSQGEGDWLKEVMTIDYVKKTTEDRIRANLALNFYNWDNSKYEWMVEERARLVDAPDFENFCYAVVRCVNGMLDEPTSDMLRNINVPTYIIFGKQDGLIPNPILHGGFPKDIADIGMNNIPGAQLVLLNDAGHLSMVEKSSEFNKIIVNFLQ